MSTTIMRDGTQVEDPRLGRLIHFDEKSKLYKAVDRLEAGEGPRSYTWRMRKETLGPVSRINGLWIDQGGEGSCVGHGIVHEVACPPKIVKGLDNTHAVDVYKRAQRIDPWEGEAYEGTSVLAGLKIGVENGWYSEYRWAFGEDELWATVGRLGPAVLGIPWYESMYAPNKNGYLVPEGRVVGGHCLILTGQSVKRGDYEGLNSWDTFGPFKIARPHMARLLREGGEAAIPTRLAA